MDPMEAPMREGTSPAQTYLFPNGEMSPRLCLVCGNVLIGDKFPVCPFIDGGSSLSIGRGCKESHAGDIEHLDAQGL